MRAKLVFPDGTEKQFDRKCIGKLGASYDIQEEPRRFARLETDATFTFTKGECYDELLALYKSDKCQVVQVVLTYKCEGQDKTIEGQFTPLEFDINQPKCRIEVKMSPKDVYDCVVSKEQQKKKITINKCPKQSTKLLNESDSNFYENFNFEVAEATTIIAIPAGTQFDGDLYYLSQDYNLSAGNQPIQIPTEYCPNLGLVFTIIGPNTETLTSNFPTTWWPRQTEWEFLGTDGTFDTYNVQTFWQREVYIVPTGTTPPGFGWVFNYTENGNDYYVRCGCYNRFPDLPTVTNTDGSISEITSDEWTEDEIQFNNGRLFSDAVAKVFEDCGHEVKSQLLDINTSSLTLIDNQYYRHADVIFKHATLHSLGDIIRPYATGFATKIELCLEQIECFLKSIDSEYWIEGNCVRIEHKSYGRDLKQLNPLITESGKLSPIGDKDKVPSQRIFESLGKTNPCFEAPTWFYDGSCSNPDEEEEIESCFHYDLFRILENPNEFDGASDELVLISNIVTADGYCVDGQNSGLTWSNIIDCFHYFGGYLPTATVDGKERQIESPKPVISTGEMRMKLPCDFDPICEVDYKGQRARFLDVKIESPNGIPCRVTFKLGLPC